MINFSNFCPKINLPKQPSFYLILIIFIGLLIRVPYLIKYHDVLNMDEAVYGIMAQDIIRGEKIPLFFYGQEYFGPLEALFTIPFFLVFSSSTLILRMSVLVLTLLGLFLFWRGLRLMVRESSGFTALGWLAISPLILNVRSIQPSGHMGGLFCGGLIFYLAARVLTSPKRQVLDFFLWGLASGFGLWMHPGTLIYVISSGFIFLLKDFRSILFFPFSILGCLAGGFPFWVRTTTLRFETFNFGQIKLNQQIYRFFIKDLWQSITNMNALLGYDGLPNLISLMVWGCIIIFLLSSILLLCRRSKEGFSQEDLILIFAWMVIGLTLFAYSYIHVNRPGDVNYRYYIPILIGLALIFDRVLNRLGNRSPNSRLWLILFLLSINLWTNYQGYKNQTYLRYEVHLEESYFQWKSLIPLLEQKKIDKVYINFIDEGPINFIANGKIGCSEFFNSRYPGRTLAVDGTSNPAFIFQDPKEAGLFKQGLDTLGSLQYTFFQSPSHKIFHNIKAPEEVFLPIDRHSIQISSCPNNQTSQFLLDENMATVWSTDGPQKGNEVIYLDLKKEVNLTRIDLVPRWLDTYPIHISIETSLDNQRWLTAADLETSNTLFWTGPHPGYKVWEGFFQYIFRKQKTRYIRIKQTGASQLPWELAEIFLYTSKPGKEAVSRIEWESITGFLKMEGIQRLVSDLFFSPNIIKHSLGKISATVRYNDLYPDPLVKKGYSPEEMPAVCVHQRDQAKVVDFLNQQQWHYQVHRFGEYRLFYHLKSPLTFTNRLDIGDLTLTISHNQKESRLMIDRNKDSRWTSLTPRESGMYLLCDFKKVKEISAIILDPGPQVLDIANNLEIFHSIDGIKYQKIDNKVRFHQKIRWTGSHLIGSGTSSAYIFLPIKARYLKMVCGENNNRYYWSIGELEILGPPEGG